LFRQRDRNRTKKLSGGKMNLKVVLKVLGTVLFWESVLMVPPLIISIIDNSYDRDAFIVTIVLVGFIGLMLKSIKVTVNIRKREAYASVALSWLLMSLFGALHLKLYLRSIHCQSSPRPYPRSTQLVAV
jgi:Trk-type K+ transport system membrane component